MLTIIEQPLLTSHAVRAPINLTQWTDFSWASELTFTIDVQQTVGSPTAGTLTAKFQKRIPNRTGSEQWATQRLVDLTPNEKAAWIAEGDWPPPLAAYNFGAVISEQRTVRGFGHGLNLVLDAPGLAGGTNPAFQVSVTLLAKG